MITGHQTTPSAPPPGEHRFRLIYPHATIDLRAQREWSDFPLMVDEASSDTESAPPPADSPAPAGHRHDFVEMVYVRSGSGLHWHQGRRHSIYAGDCYVILPGEEHTYRSTSRLSITNVLFYPEVLQPYRDTLLSIPGFRRFFTTEPLFREETSFRHKLHLSLTSQATVTTLVDGIRAETTSRTAGYEVGATGLFLQLVVHVSRAFDRSLESLGAVPQFEGRESLVSAAIAYLEQNFSSDVRVEDIARSVFISASRLSHVFKETTGMSLGDYLTRMRIDRACQLLMQGELSITQIAFSLGFNDSAYFTRLFSKTTGMSPTVYRHQQAGLSKRSAAK